MEIKSSKIKYVEYIVVLTIATFLTFFFHEMSHWLTYEFLGFNASFTLNGASVKDSSIMLSKTQRIVTSASGPIFTIIQATIFYFILNKHRNILLYPFLFIPFIMRLGAMWANQFEPNDEGRISLYLGLNLYTLSTFIVAFLFYLVFKITKKNKIPLSLNFLTLILTIMLMFCIVYLDYKYNFKFV